MIPVKEKKLRTEEGRRRLHVDVTGEQVAGVRAEGQILVYRPLWLHLNKCGPVVKLEDVTELLCSRCLSLRPDC